jgi:hypothetical protein
MILWWLPNTLGIGMMSLLGMPWYDVRRVLWMGSLGLASAIAGALGRTLASRVWKLLCRAEPPEEPDSSITNWNDALLWTFTASILGGLVGVTMRRILRTVWRYVMGEEPPV